MRLGDGAFALDRVTDTFNLSCSASVSVRLFLLTTDSVAVISSITGTSCGVTAKFNPSAMSSFSGWISFLSDKFFTQT